MEISCCVKCGSVGTRQGQHTFQNWQLKSERECIEFAACIWCGRLSERPGPHIWPVTQGYTYSIQVCQRCGRRRKVPVKPRMTKQCTCGGENPNCFKCHGTGVRE